MNVWKVPGQPRAKSSSSLSKLSISWGSSTSEIIPCSPCITYCIINFRLSSLTLGMTLGILEMRDLRVDIWQGFQLFIFWLLVHWNCKPKMQQRFGRMVEVQVWQNQSSWVWHSGRMCLLCLHILGQRKLLDPAFCLGFVCKKATEQPSWKFGEKKIWASQFLEACDCDLL